MRRLFLSATASFACALATTGCASFSSTSQPSPKTAAANTAAAQPAGVQQVSHLPVNINGELARARAFRAKGQYRDAIHILSQLMLVSPNNAGVVGEYGKTLTQQGRSSDAVDFLTRAIELKPDDWTLYSAIGVDYDQLGKHKDAEIAYKHALSLKPNDPVVLNNYAISQMMAGHLDRAETLLSRAEADGGDETKIKNNLAMIAKLRTKDHAEAGAAAKKAPATGLASAKPAPKPAMAAVKQAPRPKPAHDELALVTPTPVVGHAKLTAKWHSVQTAKAHAPAKSRVVMEKVPFDPHTGKLYPTSAHHHSTAAKTKTAKRTTHHTDTAKAAAAKREHKELAKDSVPALRTASDLY